MSEFRQEVERDAARRAHERKNRESVAENMRKYMYPIQIIPARIYIDNNSIIFRLGNAAFRESDYERALCMYNKAIDHIKDSPILYNNRALTYIRFVFF